MQQENRNFSEFKLRMDALAAALGKNLTDLPEIIEVSQSTLFAHRSGKLPISSKTWRKLEAAERKAGIRSENQPTPIPEHLADHPFAQAAAGNYLAAVERVSAALEKAIDKDHKAAAAELTEVLKLLNDLQRQNPHPPAGP